MITQDLNPIYLKLADRVCDNILCGKYNEDERIPSVRDFAADHEVNPNTVMRAFDWLQQKEIIYNKRGMGYFVSPNAKDLISSVRKEQFKNTVLPSVFKSMYQLNIDIEEVIKEYKQYKTQKK
ncbi:MAG: GntR family transcriptional regulator [Bacteroidales bacterium]|jgi:DNA-binding transcriptional regulator YhcF (GntR family)|nr:GntR family transcriptional regulator [Bacteroidales bacterium]MDD4002009.1 GntR family transcriptional regulator [Bacteroidales bacterium]MDD4528718.1 GntR family transcriptional regulator [Bacteroidales bacterium]